MRRRSVWLGLIVPLLIIVPAIADIVHARHGSHLPIAFPNQPIPGVEVALVTAQAAVSYPVPLLPSIQLADPCTGAPTQLRLLAVWASPSQSPAETQVGLTYSDGVWLSVSPLSQFVPSVQKAGELPPVQDFFPASDYPTGLVTSDVRGHTAWVKEISPNFSCATTSAEGVSSGTGSSGGPSQAPPAPIPGAVMYDPTMISVLSWAEKGVVVDMAGPYPTSEMKKIASGIEWK